MELTSLVGALAWDPQIRGFIILLVAVLILPGSVYLLLATNTGARIGFLLALAGLTGWMVVMSIVWMAYGIGLRGRDPSWRAREVVTDQAGRVDASTVDAVDGFPNGWKKLPAGDPELAEAQAAADKSLAKSAAKPAASAHGHVEEKELTPDEKRAQPLPFAKPEDYIVVAGYDKGGDNPLFTIGNHPFYLRHSPRYAIVQVRPVLEQAPLGGAPPRPAPDVREPVTSVIMIRDLGSIRFPPFVLAVSSLIIFAITCNALHRRDKEIMARRLNPAPAPA